MSNAALNWSRKVSTGSGTLKAVLRYLAELCNDEWRCWPSVGTIATETEYSRRTVQDALQKLEDMGIIGRAIRGREGGGRLSDSYLLNRNYASGKGAASAPLVGAGMAKVRELHPSSKGAAIAPAKVQDLGGKGAAAAPEPLRTQNLLPKVVINTPREAGLDPAEAKQRKVRLVRADNPALFLAAIRISAFSPTVVQLVDGKPDWPFDVDVVTQAAESLRLRLVHAPPGNAETG